MIGALTTHSYSDYVFASAESYDCKPMILVTGATGFVGSALTRRLTQERKSAVLAVVRRAGYETLDGARYHAAGNFLPHTNWNDALHGVNVVVHTAARVHLMKDAAKDPLAEFRSVNVEATLNLARQAAAAGVDRFIFISSIKVNGETTPLNHPFRADDVPAPRDPYGVSKWEAEQGLRKIAAQSGMAVTIIRPPLVYGPGVKANFLAMMRWLRRGIPLPLGAIPNQRSLVALDNLVDLVVTCRDHPGAANQTFLVSDGEDLSTTELLRRLGPALGSPARLFPVPSALLALGAGLAGKLDLAQRLCGSLQIDISKTRQLLGWMPPLTVDEGLRRAADWFLREANG